MRIAQVAPLYESVPPKLYGGTERVVSYLTEELVRQGHEVTLFASGDSQTQARLISPCQRALRLDATCRDQMAPHITMLDQVFEHAEEFDLVHFHVDYLHFPLSRMHPLPRVTTLHGRLDIPESMQCYRRFSREPLVSISDSQRAPLPELNWRGTIYHGLPETRYRLDERGGDYLAFIGRISPEKRPDRAIEIARQTGLPLKIAAKVDGDNMQYFEQAIRPLLNTADVEFIGEIGDEDKQEFLGRARALVFPIDWPEPFGLVMIESLACGTPVIGWRCGSVPEILDHGVTGFICDDMSDAVAAVNHVYQLSRRQCREVFEKRFSATRMAEDYHSIYQSLITQGHESLPSRNGRNHPISRPVLHSRHLVPS